MVDIMSFSARWEKNRQHNIKTHIHEKQFKYSGIYLNANVMVVEEIDILNIPNINLINELSVNWEAKNGIIKKKYYNLLN